MDTSKRQDLNDEALAEVSAGFFPFLAVGVVAVAAGGTAALWGHKRAGLKDR